MGRGDRHVYNAGGGSLCGAFGPVTTGRTCQECVWEEEKTTFPVPSRVVMQDSADPWLQHVSDDIDVSIILGTVRRPSMLRDCIVAIRASIAGSFYTYEIVVA